MPRETAVAVVTGLILGRPTCVDCIASKSSMPTDEAEAVLRRIASVVQSHREPTRCRVCGETKAVFSVADPRL